MESGGTDMPVCAYKKNSLQEAQLPQRNSASAVHVYLDWLTDRAKHRTPQNRRVCVIFWLSNALIQEVLARKRILTWNSHSRSFKVIHFAIINRQGAANSHIILLAVSLKFLKT